MSQANQLPSGTSTGPSAPISYAQAAKRTAPPQPPPPSAESKAPAPQKQSKEAMPSAPVTNGIEAFSWADDAADASTLVETCNSSNPGDAAASSPDNLPPDELPSRAEESHDKPESGELVDANPSQNESIPQTRPTSPTRPHHVGSGRSSRDMNWRDRSGAASEVTEPRSSEVDSPSNGSARGSEADFSAGKPLSVAPPPAVNIWTQRALDRKAKQANTTSPGASSESRKPEDPNSSNTGGLSQRQAGNDTVKNATNLQNKPSGSQQTKETNSTSFARRNNRRDRSESLASQARPQRASRPDESSNTTTSSQKQQASHPPKDERKPPEISDQVSWPTPDTAQTDVRRRSSDKGDKQESDRTLQASQANVKAHGKQEWVSMPFTPTVKFETPIPGTNRRGGNRFSGRGNREGGGRGGAGASQETKANDYSAHRDSKPEVNRRGRAGSNAPRSSSLPGRPSKKPATVPEAAGKDQDPVPSPVHISSDVTSNVEKPAIRESSGKEAAHDRNGSQETDKKQSAARIPPTSPSAAAPSPTVLFQAEVNEPKPETSKASSQETSNFLREQIHSSQDNRSGSTHIDPTSSSDASTSQHDHTQHATEHSNQIPFREKYERRSDRGRGGRGARGGFHANQQVLSHLQLSNGQQTPTPAHSSLSARSAPFSNPFGTYPPNGPNYRAGPRSASIINENSSRRLPANYFPSPQSAYANLSYNANPPYTNGVYDYNNGQAPSMQLPPMVIQQMAMNGMANQM